MRYSVFAIGLVALLGLTLAFYCTQWKVPSPTQPTQRPSALSPQEGFVPFDDPPKPIGGYEAIRKNLVYPPEALAASKEGYTIVGAIIDETGQVDTCWVLRSSGSELLDQAAMRAVHKTFWEPARQAGEPVRVRISVTVRFELSTEPGEEPEVRVSRIRHGGISRRKSLHPQESRWVPYDVAPSPIGGYQSIQKNLIYPKGDREKGVQGTVIVQALIGSDGEVKETRILKSLSPGCDQAAMEAIRKVRWKPAIQEGQPVDVWVSITIGFLLKSIK